MNKHQHGLLLIFFSIISLGIVSFISCFLAESNKAKKEDVKLDNKVCYLPESRAFWFGFAAIMCLVIAQIIGNLILCSNFWSRKDAIANSSKSKKPKIGIAFWVLSWMSFGGAVTILSAATSMSKEQAYGKGWLNQECYLVKDGMFIGSGILGLISISTTLASTISVFTKPKLVEQQTKTILNYNNNNNNPNR